MMCGLAKVSTLFVFCDLSSMPSSCPRAVRGTWGGVSLCCQGVIAGHEVPRELEPTSRGNPEAIRG